MLKPQLVNGKWRKPLVQARQRAELRFYFERAGVPWIYEKETPEVHENSTYNRRPKKPKEDSTYEIRLATIRRALSTQDERLDKLRQERLAAKPWSGHDKIMVGVLKALQAEETEAKKATTKQSQAANKAAENAELKDMGIEGFSKKTGSKAGMTSKGGSIGKKEREVLSMAKGNMGFEIAGAATPAKEEKKK